MFYTRVGQLFDSHGKEIFPGLNGDISRDFSYEVDWNQWNYLTPWCRCAPYIVGIITGYCLHITKGKDFRINWVRNHVTVSKAFYNLNQERCPAPVQNMAQLHMKRP